jgi:type III restriction enzyme
MQLKEYQTRILQEVKVFLDLLAAQQAAGNKHATLDAWEDARSRGLLPLAGIYQERRNGLGKDLPTLCIKVPTGGGKTLLATQVLGLIHQTLLKQRNGTGLVLWVVPSDQIYKDTLKALRDRRHFYRESLEHALSRRLEIWEKQDIARLTPAQLAGNLNILLLMLPSTRAQVKERLKFFRDSGGNIVLHFPPEDEPQKHKEWKERLPNLEMLGEDAGYGTYLLKTSLANLVRLCEPAVILDEGHKATSTLARQTVEGFNPAVVVELSATPARGANVVVRVSGQELLDEEMIKLPINVANSNVLSWKDCLTQARDKRERLAELATVHYRETGYAIRPLVLVQVERTGKNQREVNKIHSEDVKEYLMERLGVPEAAIAIKSSEKDDIEGIDLLADGCPIEWIITKAALQEGWDCPFAYILVSLNNTASQQSMTQLVGRVLRQPNVTRTAHNELNESYVYCLRKKAADISKEVKKALEKEGYEGEAASVVDASGSAPAPAKRAALIREEFTKHYRKPFEGKIYLPRFCVRNGKKQPEKLDYFQHLLSQVDVTAFDYAAVNWDLADTLAAARDSFYRITLDQEDVERVTEQAAASLENDDQVKAWLVANLPFDSFSYKQLRQVVQRVTERLCQVNAGLAGNLALVKFMVREKTAGFIDRETDRQTEAAFKNLFEAKKLCFYLECLECRFEIPEKVEVRAMRQLAHDNGDLTRHSLFDYVPDDLNEYERSVALFLDAQPQVLWWYRNLVGPENFSIQGYRRNLIYPDFLVQEGRATKPIARVLVLESKGKHLKGSEDTNYKRSVADYFAKAGRKVLWQKLGEEFENHQFRFQILDEGDYADRDWRDELKRLLEESGEGN